MSRLDIYFGLPRSGKTTFAAYLAKQAQKKGQRVLSNMPIGGCYLMSTKDLGKYKMEDALILIDEAGLEFDNRKMALTDDQNYFFKYFGHMNNDVAVFSQSLDEDIKIRRNAHGIFLMRHSLLPGVFVRLTIARDFGVDEAGQLVDKYKFVPWWQGGCKWIYGPSVWHMFDTHSRKVLPEKNFEYVPLQVKSSVWELLKRRVRK